jgi:sec-independent protein translocase protein TatC
MIDQLQPFVSHLIELRNRLLRTVIVLMLTFVGLFHWAQDIYHWLAMPMLSTLPQGGQMIATDVTTPFFVPLKVTLMAAFLVTLPHTLYQMWAFIAPGLYQHEKRFILPLVVSSVLLFFVGMAFAYYLVFPVAFGFFVNFAPDGVAVMTDISKYLDFVLGMFVAFGVTFETPVIVVLLVHMGIVPLQTLKESRSYVIVGAFVIAAIVTPPDILSQIMLAIPLWLLFELGVLIAGWLQQPRITPPQSLP